MTSEEVLKKYGIKMSPIEKLFFETAFKYLCTNPSQTVIASDNDFFSEAERSYMANFSCNYEEDFFDLCMKEGYGWFVFNTELNNCYGRDVVNSSYKCWDFRFNGDYTHKGYGMSPYTAIGGMYPDFIISCKDRKFVVELDGKQWHSATDEQVLRDKQKDRIYLSNGYIPIRFTGSEITKNCLACVKETLDIIVSFFRDQDLMLTDEDYVEDGNRIMNGESA